MDCIGTNMLSGDGGGYPQMSWFSPAFCFDTKTPAPEWTQTLTQEEQCTLGKIAGWFSWHKMQALPCRTCGSEGSARPFHHRPYLFLSLAGLLDWAEAPWRRCDFQCGARSSRLQHILCFPPSVWNSAIWWVLDDQARLILSLRQNFFLPTVSTLLYHLPHIYRAYRCFMSILYNKSVLVIQGI